MIDYIREQAYLVRKPKYLIINLEHAKIIKQELKLSQGIDLHGQQLYGLSINIINQIQTPIVLPELI